MPSTVLNQIEKTISQLSHDEQAAFESLLVAMASDSEI